MADQRGPLYLARASYRRRRLIDALRLLPFLLLALWMLPLLWGGEGTDQPVGAGARAFLHVFLVWALGVILAAWLAFRLSRAEGPTGSGAAEGLVEDPLDGPTDGAARPSAAPGFEREPR
ncbi:hypothetical protein [Celeribacter neptunius]|uniref:Uncharacterized protein n=1 Tax=Celeribacter neptunius TaxID=588602 RepID=A0A1I3M4A2_9RHOB|nr:hypothetical protein [Celeribacter neptunius]SFI91798.1 hypothetical protein SAMN04487991_1240 [Celeribacter neptunius]